ncbi:hypothetical protein ACFL9S_00400 [Erwinia sp. AnSW2-5]|uniref:hypothetical protein n=1 Tax=Erwinia sp. AnSW2-5 TaxID=3367692 RepID=UPI00385AB1DF
MTVRISVISDHHHYRWYHWQKKHHKRILKFLQDTIGSEKNEFNPDNKIADSYPWCFVFSAKHLYRKHYYIGALTMSKNNGNKDSLCVIFSCLPYDKISAEFKKKSHIAFWQARILATRQGQRNDNKKNPHFSEWIKALQIHYSPFLESILIRKNYRFVNTSESLLSNFNILDNQTSINGGVEFMPWNNWPECVQPGDFIWLWRQSRYGRIIDSRKIPIPRDITNVRR